MNYPTPPSTAESTSTSYSWGFNLNLKKTANAILNAAEKNFVGPLPEEYVHHDTSTRIIK